MRATPIRDEGDWSNEGECGPAQNSFFHGLFVAGQIAANTNNASAFWPHHRRNDSAVRVLGRCGGTFEDVLAGVLWSSGVPIAGVPANPNPAVINLSLGGLGHAISRSRSPSTTRSPKALSSSPPPATNPPTSRILARELQRCHHRRRRHAGCVADQLFQLRPAHRRVSAGR
jgi:hypothetical protein